MDSGLATAVNLRMWQSIPNQDLWKTYETGLYSSHGIMQAFTYKIAGPLYPETALMNERHATKMHPKPWSFQVHASQFCFCLIRSALTIFQFKKELFNTKHSIYSHVLVTHILFRDFVRHSSLLLMNAMQLLLTRRCMCVCEVIYVEYALRSPLTLHANITRCAHTHTHTHDAHGVHKFTMKSKIVCTRIVRAWSRAHTFRCLGVYFSIYRKYKTCVVINYYN